MISCSPWQLIKEPMDITINQNQPELVQVKTINGTEYILYQPFVFGDSLYGGIKSKDGGVFTIIEDTISIAVYAITEIEQKTSDNKNIWGGVISSLVIMEGLTGVILILIQSIYCKN
jgi:hypothetical protein